MSFDRFAVLLLQNILLDDFESNLTFKYINPICTIYIK